MHVAFALCTHPAVFCSPWPGHSKSEARHVLAHPVGAPNFLSNSKASASEEGCGNGASYRVVGDTPSIRFDGSASSTLGFLAGGSAGRTGVVGFAWIPGMIPVDPDDLLASGLGGDLGLTFFVASTVLVTCALSFPFRVDHSAVSRFHCHTWSCLQSVC